MAIARMRDPCLAFADRLAGARQSASLISVRVIVTPAISTPANHADSIDSQNGAHGNPPGESRLWAAGMSGGTVATAFRPNTMMLFGDAKQMCDNIVKALGPETQRN